MTDVRTVDQTSGSLVDRHTPARLSAQRLRNTLRLNTFTSLAGGLAAAAAGGPVARLLGVDRAGWVRLVGVGLCVFAVWVLTVAGSRLSRLLRDAPIVAAGDAVWVLASGITIALDWYSTRGDVVIAALAAVVGWLALRQAASLHRTRRLVGDGVAEIDETPPVEVVHVEHTVVADGSTAWSVITDHELYGRLAPNLSRVTAGGPNGPGLTRACVNRAGQQWHEACTLWEEQRRYEVAVDTTDYPYPLEVMCGAWSADPVGPDQVRLAMDFRFQPRPGLRGRLFAVAMHAAFPLVLRRILRGWRNEIAKRND